MLFGVAPRPLELGGGLTLGGGTVYPEINFTLPPMAVNESTWPDVVRQYREMIDRLVRRAQTLELPGLVVEFEHVPEMTQNPALGEEITSILREGLDRGREAHGLSSALRVTIVDLRDVDRPPRLRSGAHWEAMLESWRRCGAAGADVLSIESVGGKEVHDQALLHGDVPGIVYSLGVLAARDMEWLWDALVAAARDTETVPGGDSACGFANTAMQLAHQRQLPETLAAVDRAMGAARSLVAMECGAPGPSKDCAYEGPILKAIAGCPISMEGKSAACAHFSPIGNIAAMAADLWSNESVQNVRLLSGPAPEAFLEILAYDCRLFNEASAAGNASMLRELLVSSDAPRSPQALVLSPDATMRIARAIVAEDSDYGRTVAAARTAVALIREAALRSVPALSARESRWLDTIERELDDLPDSPGELEGRIRESHGALLDPASYGLE